MLKQSTILGRVDNTFGQYFSPLSFTKPVVRQYNSFKFKQLPGSQSFYILAEERTSQYIIEGKHKAVFRRSTMASSMDIDSESQGSINITTDRNQ